MDDISHPYLNPLRWPNSFIHTFLYLHFPNCIYFLIYNLNTKAKKKIFTMCIFLVCLHLCIWISHTHQLPNSHLMMSLDINKILLQDKSYYIFRVFLFYTLQQFSWNIVNLLPIYLSPFYTLKKFTKPLGLHLNNQALAKRQDINVIWSNSTLMTLQITL